MYLDVPVIAKAVTTVIEVAVLETILLQQILLYQLIALEAVDLHIRLHPKKL
jgi:hypothetical protein